MATPKQPVLTIAGASGILQTLTNTLGSVLPSAWPSGADNAIIRFDSGTARWSETGGSWLSPTTGLIVSAADAPFRISNPSAFAFVPVGGAATLQALPYQGFYVL